MREPSPAWARRAHAARRRARGTAVAALVTMLAATPGQAAPAGTTAAPARPRDPDETPRMRAPAGQPQTDDRRKDGPWATGASSRRRLALAVTPLFAVYRLAFLGRTPAPVRGGGLAVDLDVLIYQPVSVRVTASYSAHRLQDAYTVDGDNGPKLSARGGTLHTLDFGGAVLFAMDLGRARPLLEAGIGGMMVRTPDAVQDGQRGGTCLDGGGCDVGLACAKSENICRQSVIPRLHAGAGIEVFLSDRWTIGASIRYYALLMAPTVFPVYLQAGLRVGVRF